MIKYSQYKNTIFLGIDETETINEGFFKYLGQLLKKSNTQKIDVQEAKKIQYAYSLELAKSLVRLKFRKFSLYRIVFDLKDLLKTISVDLIQQIEEDYENDTNIILDNNYRNNQNLLFILENTTNKIKNYIQNKALEVIKIRYPDSKISPNYDSNKKIIRKFKENFNVIFKPYKKSTSFFSKKVEDVSPFEMLANKIIKNINKYYDADLESLYVKDINLEDDFDDISVDDGDGFNAKMYTKDGNTIDFDKIKTGSNIELKEPYKSYYEYYFSGSTALDNIIKNTKKALDIYGTETAEQRNYFVQLTKPAFVRTLFRKHGDILKKGIKPKQGDFNRLAQKDIVYDMVRLYQQDMANFDDNNTTHPDYDPASQVYSKGENDETESDKTKGVPKGYEGDFVTKLNRYFQIRKRAKVIDAYAKENDIEFPNSMFKTTEKLVLNAFKKYLYKYKKDPSENLDYRLLVDLFGKEYEKYLEKQEENKESDIKEQPETEEAN